MKILNGKIRKKLILNVIIYFFIFLSSCPNYIISHESSYALILKPPVFFISGIIFMESCVIRWGGRLSWNILSIICAFCTISRCSENVYSLRPLSISLLCWWWYVSLAEDHVTKATLISRMHLIFTGSWAGHIKEIDFGEKHIVLLLWLLLRCKLRAKLKVNHLGSGSFVSALH